jgi:hypothetical protein
MASRLLKLEPARVLSVAGLVYGAAAMAYRALVAHTGPWDADLAVAAAIALYGLWIRAKVTPVDRPRDAEGRELVPRQVPPRDIHRPQPGGM